MIRMSLNLHDGRLDPRRFKNLEQGLHATIRKSYCAAFAFINKVFHCLPGFEEGHALVVYYIAVFIPWILVVPWFECEWGVNEIKIEIIESQLVHARLACGLNAFRPVIGIPKLCRDEQVLA